MKAAQPLNRREKGREVTRGEKESENSNEIETGDSTCRYKDKIGAT